MTDSRGRMAPQYRRVIGGAIGAAGAGLVIVILAIGFDWGGFGGGLALGAGIGLVVVGVYFSGYANGLRRVGKRGTWLPSRDVHG